MKTLAQVAQENGVRAATTEKTASIIHPRINISQRTTSTATTPSYMYSQKVYVAVFPKLQGLEEDKIEEWFIPAEARSLCRTWYCKPATKMIYISDGDRFWSWISWSSTYQKKSHITLEQLEEEHPNWEALPEEAPTHDQFSHIAC